MSVVANGNYKLFCAGEKGTKRWLVPNDDGVKLVESPSSSWKLETTDQGVTITSKGSYIDGNTKDGKVKLVLPSKIDSGAYWDVELSGEYYEIRCLATDEGDKQFLDGNTNKANVYLHEDTTRSGSQWLLIPA